MIWLQTIVVFIAAVVAGADVVFIAFEIRDQLARRRAAR